MCHFPNAENNIRCLFGKSTLTDRGVCVQNFFKLRNICVFIFKRNLPLGGTL